MNKDIVRTTQFKKDFKRVSKQNIDFRDTFIEVVQMLCNAQPLPERFQDHPLSGNYTGYRDCHIRPDLVLIYKSNEDSIILVRIGSHSEVFNN